MCIEMEAADMLVDSGEGIKALNSCLSRFHDFAMQALGLPWNVLYGGSLHTQSQCPDMCHATR